MYDMWYKVTAPLFWLPFIVAVACAWGTTVNNTQNGFNSSLVECSITADKTHSRPPWSRIRKKKSLFHLVFVKLSAWEKRGAHDVAHHPRTVPCSGIWVQVDRTKQCSGSVLLQECLTDHEMWFSCRTKGLGFFLRRPDHLILRRQSVHSLRCIAELQSALKWPWLLLTSEKCLLTAQPSVGGALLIRMIHFCVPGNLEWRDRFPVDFAFGLRWDRLNCLTAQQSGVFFLFLFFFLLLSLCKNISIKPGFLRVVHQNAPVQLIAMGVCWESLYTECVWISEVSGSFPGLTPGALSPTDPTPYFVRLLFFSWDVEKIRFTKKKKNTVKVKWIK